VNKDEYINLDSLLNIYNRNISCMRYRKENNLQTSPGHRLRRGRRNAERRQAAAWSSSGSRGRRHGNTDSRWRWRHGAWAWLRCPVNRTSLIGRRRVMTSSDSEFRHDDKFDERTWWMDDTAFTPLPVHPTIHWNYQRVACSAPLKTRSHPEMVGDMSRVTLNSDLSKNSFCAFLARAKTICSH